MSVAVAGLGVCFASDRLRRPVTPDMATYRRGVERVWGLRNVTLRAEPGEAVALVGPSGAGKSSLLRAIAGVYPADEGEVAVDGRVAPLLSIDAGLLAPLTGRENAELLGVLAGLTRAQSRARLETVREDSGLGADFDRTVSAYSQGMRARLGFTATALLDARVYVLDEVHEAFDHDFRGRVRHRLREARERGAIVVAAGHDHGLLGDLCERAMHLERGSVVADGPFDEVVTAYVTAVR